MFNATRTDKLFRSNPPSSRVQLCPCCRGTTVAVLRQQPTRRRITTRSAAGATVVCVPNAALQLLSNHSYGGACTCCGQAHFISTTPEVAAAAEQLVATVAREGRLDFASQEPDPRFSCDWLWTKGPGRMLGVLLAEDARGQHHVLKAFSGQITESWTIPGWCGPVAGITNTSHEYVQTRQVIGQLSARLAQLDLLKAASKRQQRDSLQQQRRTSSHQPNRHRQQQQPATSLNSAERFIAQQHQLLKQRRKRISHFLLRQIQQSYLTRSVGGAPLSLLDVYCSYVRQHEPCLPVTRTGSWTGMPAGVGDCCAPKLLHAAAAAGLRPLGLVELWFGSAPGTATPAKAGRPHVGDAASSSRQHLHSYGMCDKCRAILGSMLCPNTAGDVLMR